MSKDLKVRIDAPAKVSLFLYDNDTFIVESFLDEPVNVNIHTPGENTAITDLVSGETIECKKPGITLEPHTYRVFKLGK